MVRRSGHRVEGATSHASPTVASGADGGYVAVFSGLRPTLHPGGTLLEKLGAIHAEAIHLQADPAKRATAPIGPHLYDVSRLLTDKEVAAFLADDTAVEAVLEEIEQVSREHFAASSSDRRPEGGFVHSPAFDLSSDVSNRLRVAYEADLEGVSQGDAPPPMWEQSSGRVTSSPV